MSKRSTRGKKNSVGDNEEESTEVTSTERGLRTRQNPTGTPVLNHPTRKSGRIKDTPLYNFPSEEDEAEEFSPSPALKPKRGRPSKQTDEEPAPKKTTKKKSGKKADSEDEEEPGKTEAASKKITKKKSVKKADSEDEEEPDKPEAASKKVTKKKSVKKVDSEDEDVPEKPEAPSKKIKGKVEKIIAEPTRRSIRTPKPTIRLSDNLLPSDLIGSPSPKTPKGTEPPEATRKSARRKAETQTPISAKVLKKTEPAAESPVETPKSTRRAAAVKEPPKDTPVKGAVKSAKAKTPASSAVNKSSDPAVAATSKKLEWKFNIYGIPKCPLPCREAQFEEIWKFLFENVTERNSGCMYVSGVPGTGKTVIVQAVVDTMKNLSQNEKKNLKFKYLYINGLTLSSPDKIWKRMFKGLETVSKSISTKEALKRLDSYFESLQREPVVLVVDELDQILDKQQSILYQLLEWSSHSKNMFSFVAIFNTMSLPEHGLAMRNYSRMGFKRAVFPPYSYEQLQTIVLNMLATFKTTKLSNESVTLLSRKVAAISGDARRALEIARRAMEIAEAGNLSGIQAVSNAFKEIFSSAKIETIKYTSLLEQLILKSLCDEVRCSGVDEVLIAKIYENVIPKAVYEGMHWPKDEILKALMRLAIMHLVIVEDNVASIHKRVLLKVPVEDVNFALGIHEEVGN